MALTEPYGLQRLQTQEKTEQAKREKGDPVARFKHVRNHSLVRVPYASAVATPCWARRICSCRGRGQNVLYVSPAQVWVCLSLVGSWDLPPAGGFPWGHASPRARAPRASERSPRSPQDRRTTCRHQHLSNLHLFLLSARGREIGVCAPIRDGATLAKAPHSPKARPHLCPRPARPRPDGS